MDRVFESGAAATPPSAPANPSTGYATAGNPSTAVPATKPGDYWYHQITEEIRKVITDAGLTPSHTDLTQLSTAIQRMIAGGDYKASVRAATTANITLSGEQTIDGVAVVAGDRVLVRAQTAGAENGIYVAAAGAWARATDADTAGDLTSGVLVPVETGTSNADTIWMLTTDGAITIGTTALNFVSAVVGDASTTVKGKVQLATAAEILAGTDALKAVTAAGLLTGLLGPGGVSGNDYVTIPFRDKTTGVRSNLIIQWGSATFADFSGTANVPITYPITFPAGVVNIIDALGLTGGFNTAVAVNESTITASGFTAVVAEWNAVAQAGGKYRWLAIGY